MRITYRDAGVNIDEANRATEGFKDPVKATHNSGVLAGIGAFGGMYKLPKGYSNPVLVSSMDGVGTKLKVALKARRHNTVGEDLVNHCVNDIAVMGAIPLFLLDYYGTSKLNADVAREVVTGMARACKANDCVLLGGETAEMPDTYIDDNYDLVACIVGIVNQSLILDPTKVKPGFELIGLPSTGLHTNGYSLARKLLFETAGYKIDSHVDDLGCTVGEELLKVHRSYLRPIQALHTEGLLAGAAHITGGGITENTPRMLPKQLVAVIDTKSWTIPPIFELLRNIGNIPEWDLRRTFNLGIGMILALPEGKLAQVKKVLENLNETFYRIGVVEQQEDEDQLVYV